MRQLRVLLRGLYRIFLVNNLAQHGGTERKNRLEGCWKCGLGDLVELMYLVEPPYDVSPPDEEDDAEEWRRYVWSGLRRS
jgi:hypothetical protein